jgi:hypothetical protein
LPRENIATPKSMHPATPSAPITAAIGGSLLPTAFPNPNIAAFDHRFVYARGGEDLLIAQLRFHYED